MTAALPLDTAAAAEEFVGQLSGSQKARLLAALLRIGVNEPRELPAGMPTPEQDAEYERRVRAGGRSLSADEVREWLRTATPGAG